MRYFSKYNKIKNKNLNKETFNIKKSAIPQPEILDC